MRGRSVRARPGGLMSRRGGRRARTCAIVVSLSCALILSACAPEPGASADPDDPGLGSSSVRTEDPPAQLDGSPAPAEAEALAEVVAPDGSEPAETAGSDAPRTAEASSRTPKGLLGQRVLNTRARLAARLVYVPGVPKFNRIMDSRLRAAIRSTKRAYSPQVFPRGAGLGERGCVRGSTRWSAAKVLSRPETGPRSGSGTAMTCEVLGASGDVVRVAVRTVRGSKRAIRRDRTRVFYADVSTGAAGEVKRLWRASAPEALWRMAVEQLRQRAGGAAGDPIAAPSTSQSRLASRALERARTTADGGLLVTLPSGIAAPELAELGVAGSSTATVVAVGRATADSWSSRLGRLLRSSANAPFSGVRVPASSVRLDCRLLPCVALSYDDGPGPYTAKLLKTLRSQRARATLFMVGPNAAARPSVVRRAVADGHELASHTMTHRDLTTLSSSAARSEVRRAASLIGRIAHRRITLYRPPYGAVDGRVIDAVGMPAILWSVDTNDWRRPGRTALIERSVPVVRPGGIILFHDIHPDSVAVAGEVVTGLRDRGFELVTVSHLFGGKVPRGRVSGRY